MTKIVKFTPLLIGVIALVGFLVYINLPAEEMQNQGRANSATPVMVEQAEQREFPIVVEALGTAISNESINISAQRSQTVTKVLFDDGDLVNARQPLLELNNRAEKARLNELNINVTEARRQLERIKGLAKQSAASEQLLDEQESRVKGLIAQREVAKANLQELIVTAPFSGRLGIRQVSVGSLVRPGDTITTLDDLSIMKVDFSIAENHFSSLKNGQNVAATSVAYPGEIFTGKITNIDSRIDPRTRSIQIRATIPNPDLKLRPGMLLQINLEKRVLNALVVPESAVVPESDKQFVFVVGSDNKAVKTQIQLGERKPGWVQVLGGLAANQSVITQGTLRVRDGSSVRVLNKQGDE
jgi:membrane fusion protein (multidrug efflux system)